MSDSFDPYYKWLGIAPTEQPPNHYRLLGLNLYEPDPDVISSGSDRQMAHLRTFQTGPRVRECQQLLNEVSGARVVLLDPERKAAYDQMLRDSLTPAAVPPPVHSTPLTPADTLLPTAVAPSAPPRPLSGSSSTVAKSPVVVAKKYLRHRKRAFGAGPIAAVGAIGLIVLFAGGYGLRWMLRPEPGPIVQFGARPADNASAPRVESDGGVDAPAQSSPRTQVAQGADISTPAEPEHVIVEQPADRDKLPVAAQPVVTPAPQVPSNGESPAQPEPPSSLGDLVKDTGTTKLAVPAEAELVAARAQLESLFPNALSEERSPQEAAAFADELKQHALQPGTEPVMRYVILEAAVSVAAQGGAVNSASSALRELDLAFSADLVPLKADAARQIARIAKEAWEHKAVAELLETVIDECLAADRYELAMSLAEAASDAARKSRDSFTIGRVVARSRDIKSLDAKYEPVRSALSALADDSDDPTANETMGRHLCLVKGNWDQGLPYLVKSGASALRDVAARDIRKPTNAETQAEIGNGWMNVAAQLDRSLRLQALLRAEYWYRLAVAHESGLKKLPLETHIEALGKEIGELAELPPGAVLVMTFEPSTLKRRGYVLDVSQHGYVGAVHGAVLAEGIAGKALGFDGKDDYVAVASTPWLSAPSAFTLAAWVNVVSWKNTRNAVDYVLSKESAGSLGYVLRYRDGGILNLTVGVSESRTAVSTKKASLGEWHHMAATFDGHVAKVFLDGKLDGTEIVSGAIAPSDVPFHIGQAAYRKDRGILGRIDEVAIFNRALSLEEVRTVYRIGRAGRPLIE